MNITELLGKTITKITGATVNSEEIMIETSEGKTYRMFHYQDCCEHVSLDDVIGVVDELLNSPILLAEEVSSENNPEGINKKYQESFTWTFYKLGTVYGVVTFRWYGESNGYYSESVEFEEVILR